MAATRGFIFVRHSGGRYARRNSYRFRNETASPGRLKEKQSASSARMARGRCGRGQVSGTSRIARRRIDDALGTAGCGSRLLVNKINNQSWFFPGATCPPSLNERTRTRQSNPVTAIFALPGLPGGTRADSLKPMRQVTSEIDDRCRCATLRDHLPRGTAVRHFVNLTVDARVQMIAFGRRIVH